MELDDKTVVRRGDRKGERNLIDRKMESKIQKVQLTQENVIFQDKDIESAIFVHSRHFI